MSTKSYWLQFGSGDPRQFGGLTPTIIAMFDQTGVTYVGPTITEVGVSSGFYHFRYDVSQSLSIIFLADGGAALSTNDRYVTGVLDPIQSVDVRLGYNTDSIGSTSVDPQTAMAFIMRVREWLEGNAIFTKSTGNWDVYDRGGTLLLQQKALTNTTTLATKS